MDSDATWPARYNNKHFMSKPMTANGSVQSLTLTSAQIKER